MTPRSPDLLTERFSILILLALSLVATTGCPSTRAPRPVRPVTVKQKVAPKPTYTQVAKSFLGALRKGDDRKSYSLLAPEKIQAEAITAARWRRVVASWQVGRFKTLGFSKSRGYGVVLVNTTTTAVGATRSATISAIGIVLKKEKSSDWKVLVFAPETAPFSRIRRISLRIPNEGQFQVRYESTDAIGKRILGAKNYYQTQPPP